MDDLISRELAVRELESIALQVGNNKIRTVARCLNAIELLPTAPVQAGWIRAADRKPAPHMGVVLVIVSGKPSDNVILNNAYELAEYYAGEGWIIEAYPEWEGADVKWWTPFPDPPEECEA